MAMMTYANYKVPVPEARKIGPGTADVKANGAVGDGKTDDTAAFNKAINSLKAGGGGIIEVPDGNFLIDPLVGINMASYSWLKMSPTARLITKSNDQIRYGLVRINGVTEVLVTGGRAFGDRYTHTYRTAGLSPAMQTHEWGHCFQVYGSNRITVRDFMASGFTGDGLSMASKNVSGGSAEEQVFDVHIDNVLFADNRRQGCSVGKACDVVISNSTFAFTNGTNPQCGIDIEPENNGEARRVHVFRCNLASNNANGILALRRSNVNSPVGEVYVVECNIVDNTNGAYISNVEGFAFYRNIVTKQSQTGLRLSPGTTGVVVQGNTFGFNYNRGGTGADRSDVTRTGVDKSVERDVLVRNDPAENSFPLNTFI